MAFSLYNQVNPKQQYIGSMVSSLAKPVMNSSLASSLAKQKVNTGLQKPQMVSSLSAGPTAPTASPAPSTPRAAYESSVANDRTSSAPTTIATPQTPATYSAPVAQAPSRSTAYDDAMQAYINSLAVSPQESSLRERLNKLTYGAQSQIAQQEQNPIPGFFITGRQKQIRDQALAEAGLLDSELSRAQAERQGLSDAARARLEYESKLLPNTEGFTLGEGQTRYDAAGNPVASAPKMIGNAGNAEINAYASAVQSGKLKLENVPQDLRGSVALSLSQLPQTEDPKAQYVKSQADEALTNIDLALGYLNGENSGLFNTAGNALGRAIGGFIPGSDVTNLNSAIDTVKALVGFDALQKMRDSSPTGGALGQITERELAFLQSVQGSLNTLQGTEQLISTLNRIRQSFQTLQIVNSLDGTVFELDGKKYIKQGNQMIPQDFSSVGGDTKQAANRPQRNNNPLNIKASAATSTYPGVIGTDTKAASDGGNFLVFATPQDGFNAAKTLLQTSGYKNLTVDAALKRWSNNGYGGEIAPTLSRKTVASLTQRELDTLIGIMAKREGYYA